MDIGHDLTGPKADKKKQTLIAVGTVVLIVIAYLTLRKMSGGTSTGAAATPTNGGSGGTAAGGQTPDLTGIQYQLDTLSGMVASLKPSTTSVTLPVPAPVVTTPAPSGAKKTSNQKTASPASTPHYALVGAKSETVGSVLSRWVDASGKAMSLTAFRRLNPTLNTYQAGGKEIEGKNTSTNDTVRKGEKINVTGFHLLKTPPKPAHPATHG